MGKAAGDCMAIHFDRWTVDGVRLDRVGARPTGSAYRRHCFRETDGRVALLVQILLDQTRVSARLGLAAQAGACARECIPVAARAHMNSHLRRAVRVID